MKRALRECATSHTGFGKPKEKHDEEYYDYIGCWSRHRAPFWAAREWHQPGFEYEQTIGSEPKRPGADYDCICSGSCLYTAKARGSRWTGGRRYTWPPARRFGALCVGPGP